MRQSGLAMSRGFVVRYFNCPNKPQTISVISSDIASHNLEQKQWRELVIVVQMTSPLSQQISMDSYYCYNVPSFGCLRCFDPQIQAGVAFSGRKDKKIKKARAKVCQQYERNEYILNIFHCLNFLKIIFSSLFSFKYFFVNKSKKVMPNISCLFFLLQ